MGTLVLVFSALFFQDGGLTLEELTELARSGQNKEAILAQLDARGIAFEVNRENLLEMQRRGFADWLIDETVAQDLAAQDSDEEVSHGFPRRLSPYLSYYGARGWAWDGFYGGPMFFFSPYYWADAAWGYGGYWGDSYGYFWPWWRFVGSVEPGNALRPGGYRSSVPGRVTGQARPKDPGVAPKPAGSSSHRSGSSTGRSGSGGKVTPKGYIKD
jgi:hypothetical protein